MGSDPRQRDDAAVRQGRRPDGQPLYPEMPYPYFTRMSHEDVKDIRAYLSTIPR
jgi:mono/diheme cytochrome c family protein